MMPDCLSYVLNQLNEVDRRAFEEKLHADVGLRREVAKLRRGLGLLSIDQALFTAPRDLVRGTLASVFETPIQASSFVRTRRRLHLLEWCVAVGLLVAITFGCLSLRVAKPQAADAVAAVEAASPLSDPVVEAAMADAKLNEPEAEPVALNGQ